MTTDIEQSTDRMAKTACNLCSRNCELSVGVKDGHLTRVRGDDEHVSRVSWEPALSEIAQRLPAIQRQHGGDAFAFVGRGGQGPPWRCLWPADADGHWSLSRLVTIYWGNGRLLDHPPL